MYHPAAEFTCSEEVLRILGVVRKMDISGSYCLWLQVSCQKVIICIIIAKRHYCIILQYSPSKQALSLHLNSKLNQGHAWYPPVLCSCLPHSSSLKPFPVWLTGSCSIQGWHIRTLLAELSLSISPKFWGTNSSLKMPLASLNLRKKTCWQFSVFTYDYMKRNWMKMRAWGTEEVTRVIEKSTLHIPI